MGKKGGLPHSEMGSSMPVVSVVPCEFPMGTNFDEYFPELKGVERLLVSVFGDEAAAAKARYDRECDTFGDDSVGDFSYQSENSIGVRIHTIPVDGFRDHMIEYSGRIFPTFPQTSGLVFAPESAVDFSEDTGTYSRAVRE